MQTENSGEGFEFSFRSQEDQTCVASVVGMQDHLLKSCMSLPVLLCVGVVDVLSDWKQSF